MRYAAMFFSVLTLLAGCSSTPSSNGGTAGTSGAAGTGNAGTAAMDTDGGVSSTYASISNLLGGPEQASIGKCAASSCHGGDGLGQAGMNFKTAKSLVAALVNVPACENSSLMRVKPGDPDHSWVWIKLTADIDNVNDGNITYTGTPSSCPGVAASIGFGTRMPQVFGSFDKLTDPELAAVKAWIMDGAPGPT